MKIFTKLGIVAALATALPALAVDYSVVGLGFEGMQVQTFDDQDPPVGKFLRAQVWNFYDGGYSRTSDGSSDLVLGPNDYNVAFNDAAKALMSASQDGTGNFGPRYLDAPPSNPLNPPPSGPGSLLTDLGISAVLFATTADNSVLNYANGFNNGFSFYYSSSALVTVTLFDGLNGTGGVLGSGTFQTTPPCALNDNTYCAWSIGAIPVNAVARSIRFDGQVNQALFDNVTFGSLTPIDGAIPVPEPASYALMALGLAGVAWVARRRRSLS